MGTSIRRMSFQFGIAVSCRLVTNPGPTRRPGPRAGSGAEALVQPPMQLEMDGRRKILLQVPLGIRLERVVAPVQLPNRRLQAIDARLEHHTCMGRLERRGD